jgi:uncharacterized RDD family membrane protein YckC
MSMPQGDRSGQPWETGQQPGTPGQQQYGTPQYGAPEFGAPQYGVPEYGAPEYGAPPQGPGQPSPAQFGPGQHGPGQHGAGPTGGTPGGQYGDPMEGRPISPVNEIDTRVTGRRVVQYIIDAIIVGAVAGVLSLLLNHGSGGTAAVLLTLYIVLDVLWAFGYWALLPYLRNGQTLGMQVMGIRVISLDGGPASLGQFVGRAALMIIFTPLSLLVGFITMMCSRYRQRVGDHLAKTMVVSSRVEPAHARQEYAGAGQAGAR